jgi:hypothetical protein
MPVHEAIGYVLGAYLVFVALLVTYGVILASRGIRVRRRLAYVRRALEESKR